MNNPTNNDDLEKRDDKRTAIIFLSIAAALFVACISFMVWAIVRIRNVDSRYIKTVGKVVDIKQIGSASPGYSGSSWFLIISYSFEGQEYSFVDREGFKWYDDAQEYLNKNVEILVDPQRPDRAEMPRSSGWISTFCACLFVFFCFMYSAGMLICLYRKGNSFIKRLFLIWGAEIVLGVAILLMFWSGIPNSGFGEIFSRISGSIGVVVGCGLVLLATLVDSIITLKLRPYKSKHHVYHQFYIKRRRK